MPDASTSRPPLPSGWSEAFAALPAETPPAGGWERVARALPVRHRRWPALVALAAALALVAIVPLRRATQDAAPSAPLAHAPATPDSGRASGVRPAPVEPIKPAQVAAGFRSEPNSADVANRHTKVIADVGTGSATTPASEPANAPATAAAEASTRPSTGTTDAAQLAASPAPTSRDETVEPAASPELERLYAESAQLEGLLALTRDGGGVANGAVAMLSDDLATRVAQIDAALMQPSLDSERRLALWRERVDALRQAAAFESTQRLLAARGQQYDAMLVSID